MPLIQPVNKRLKDEEHFNRLGQQVAAKNIGSQCNLNSVRSLKSEIATDSAKSRELKYFTNFGQLCHGENAAHMSRH